MEDDKLLFLKRRGLLPSHHFLDLNDYSLSLVEYLNEKCYFDIKLDKVIEGKIHKRKKTFDFIWANSVSVEVIPFLQKSLKKSGICYALIDRDDMHPFNLTCQENNLRFEKIGLAKNEGLSGNKLVIKCTK